MQKHLSSNIHKALSALLTLTVCSLLFVACDRRQEGVGNLRADVLTTDTQAYLFNDSTKPSCHLSLSLTYLNESDDPRMKDILNRLFMQKALGEKYALEPAKAIETYQADYVRSYREDLEQTFLEDARHTDNDETLSPWYNYEENISTEIERYAKSLLVYRVEAYDFTGGPHGIYGTFYTNVNLHLLSVLQLNDIFLPDFEEPLATLLWEQLKEDVGAADDEELMEFGYGIIGEVTPTENFVLREEGIEFLYNVYEIAPYSTGITTILLPYDRLKSLLNTDNLIIKEQL